MSYACIDIALSSMQFDSISMLDLYLRLKMLDLKNISKYLLLLTTKLNRN